GDGRPGGHGFRARSNLPASLQHAPRSWRRLIRQVSPSVLSRPRALAGERLLQHRSGLPRRAREGRVSVESCMPPPHVRQPRRNHGPRAAASRWPSDPWRAGSPPLCLTSMRHLDGDILTSSLPRSALIRHLALGERRARSSPAAARARGGRIRPHIADDARMSARLPPRRRCSGAVMCEHDDLDEFARRSAELTRREFGAMALGAGLLAALPKLANAAETTGADVEIRTPDGTADAYFVHPAKGKHPGVLIWPDIFGLRPAFEQMATRLAESGYSVLVINPFYRTKKAPTAPEHPDFNDPATRQELMALAGSLTPDTAVTDAKAFVAFLDSQPSVDTKRKLGTTGYCMGGPFVFRTAATFPDRIGAGATFHGGGLVTDKPDSPHLLIPEMKAHYLIAIAENDDKKQPEAKDVLR